MNYRKLFFGSAIAAMILISSYVTPLSMLVQTARAQSLLTLKWTRGSLGNGFWEGGQVIGDIMKNIPGEEVVFATDYNSGTVYALDGITGNVLWTYRDTAIYAYAQVSLYDVDGDGGLEVLVPLYFPPGLLVLRGDGTLYWRTMISGSSGTVMSCVAAADVDGEGKLEIFEGSQNVVAGADERFTGKVVKFSYGGQVLAETFTWRSCSGGISIADTDYDGEIEVYAGDRHMYMGDGDYGKGTRSFWASNLTSRWSHPDILCSSQCPVLADVNNDGILEAIVSDQRGGLMVFNSTTGSAIRKSRNLSLPGHYQLTVHDVDGDGHLEVLTADGTHTGRWSSTEVVIFDLVDWKVDARLPVGLCKFSPTLADLNNDGAMDIIAVNMTTVFVYTYDKATKSYVKIEEESGLSYGLTYAVVQDIDADGLVEVVVARASGSSARIYAFDTTASKPANRVRSEVKWYSENRRGAAEYIPPPVGYGGIQLGAPQSTFQEPEPGSSSGITVLALASPQTFGKTDIGTSYVNLAQYTYGSRYQILEDGVARSMTLYVQERNGENRILKVAIYNDNAGVPTNLLAQGATTIPANHVGWITVDLTTQPSLIGGKYYWLVANAQASGKIVRFYYSTGSTNQAIYASTSSASFPIDPCQYTGFKNRAHSIYCSYSPTAPTPPAVVSHIPLAGAVDVPVGTSVQVTFSEPMNHAATEAAFSLDSTSGSFGWSSDDTVMTFTPSSNLAPNTLYTATITTAAQDQEGENMELPYSWTFTTEAPAPILTSSDGTHSTWADLICYPTDTSARNIFSWYVNDVSLANLIFTFDENDPTRAKDYSPYSNDGELHGATWTNNGIVGGAYFFDGNFDYVKVSDGDPGYFPGYPIPSNLGGDGTWSELTVELWVNISPVQNPGAQNPPVSDVRFLAKIPSFEIGLDTSRRLFAGVWTQRGTDHTELGSLGSRTARSSASLSSNTWHHVALTYKDGVGLALYLNGTLVGSNTAAMGNIHCSSGEPLCLGWFDYFRGMIDEVRLYPRWLSQEQIAQRYLETKEGWNDKAVIKSSETQGLEVWKCQVIQGSTSRFSNVWQIDNTSPAASNLKIGPRQILAPSDTDNLRALYSYYDIDEHPESGSEIRWYRNGALQPELNDQLTVPSSLTNPGEQWYFTVRPKDGTDFGDLATSPTVSIVANRPPEVVGTPSLVRKSNGDLACTSTTTDPDGDPVRSVYNWYVNNAPIATLQMPFDTDNMFTIRDYSPYSNTGTISGATWTTAGLIGGAYYFDGNDVITVADSSTLGGDGTWSEITVEFWVKVSTPSNGTRIIAKKVGSASTGSYMVGFQTSGSPSNTVFWGITVANGTYYDTYDNNLGDPLNTVLETGKWYHVVCTYKSGPGLTIYINGTARVNRPLTGLIYATTDLTDEPLFIGYDGGGTANRYLKGTLDEVKIYRRALTPQQIQQCYLDSKDGLSGSSTIAASETKPGEVWKCAVTPNDRYQDGSAKESTPPITVP